MADRSASGLSAAPAGLAGRLKFWRRHAARPDAPPGADEPSGQGLPARPLGLAAIGCAPEICDALARRLEEELPQPGIVVQPLPTVPPAAAVPAGMLPIAERRRRAAERVLADASPDLAMWCGPLTPGSMLSALMSSRLPCLAVDVPAPAPARDRRHLRAALGRFARVLARDEAAAQALRQVGPPGSPLEVAGPLAAVPDPLPCNTAEREDFARMLGGRPVWLAVAPDAAELPDILEAHRAARLTAHRLLLILVPPGIDAPDWSVEAGGALAGALRAEHWTVARRALDEEPHEASEIYVADTPDELGLWYRLAPVTLLGGTLRGGPVPDPSGPASLGSAILSGPLGRDLPELGRYAEAGAAAIVARPEGLGAALSDALSPDRAASLAHAAWDVVSDGARVETRLVAAIRDLVRQVRR